MANDRSVVAKWTRGTPMSVADYGDTYENGGIFNTMAGMVGTRSAPVVRGGYPTPGGGYRGGALSPGDEFLRLVNGSRGGRGGYDRGELHVSPRAWYRNSPWGTQSSTLADAIMDARARAQQLLRPGPSKYVTVNRGGNVYYAPRTPAAPAAKDSPSGGVLLPEADPVGESRDKKTVGDIKKNTPEKVTDVGPSPEKPADAVTPSAWSQTDGGKWSRFLQGLGPGPKLAVPPAAPAVKSTSGSAGTPEAAEKPAGSTPSASGVTLAELIPDDLKQFFTTKAERDLLSTVKFGDKLDRAGQELVDRIFSEEAPYYANLFDSNDPKAAKRRDYLHEFSGAFEKDGWERGEDGRVRRRYKRVKVPGKTLPALRRLMEDKDAFGGRPAGLKYTGKNDHPEVELTGDFYWPARKNETPALRARRLYEGFQVEDPNNVGWSNRRAWAFVRGREEALSELKIAALRRALGDRFQFWRASGTSETGVSSPWAKRYFEADEALSAFGYPSQSTQVRQARRAGVPRSGSLRDVLSRAADGGGYPSVAPGFRRDDRVRAGMIRGTPVGQTGLASVRFGGDLARDAGDTENATPTVAFSRIDPLTGKYDPSHRYYTPTAGKLFGTKREFRLGDDGKATWAYNVAGGGARTPDLDEAIANTIRELKGQTKTPVAKEQVTPAPKDIGAAYDAFWKAEAERRPSLDPVALDWLRKALERNDRTLRPYNYDDRGAATAAPTAKKRAAPGRKRKGAR